MTKNYRKLITNLACITILTGGLQAIAQAATLNVKNHGDVELEVIIKPEDGKLIADDRNQTFTLKPREKKEVNVSTWTEETFSVTGKGPTPSVHNTCSKLSKDKDYDISFDRGNLGEFVCKILKDK